MEIPNFYTRLPLIYEIILITIWVIITMLSAGLLFNVTYDFFLYNKEYLNRRILYKWLLKENKSLKYTKKLILNGNNTEYIFFDNNNQKIITLWVWHKNLNITLNYYTDTYNELFNLIGLYYCSYFEKKIIIKIIKKINSLQ